eukprot:481507-Prorocentrum_lima.AAC.1
MNGALGKKAKSEQCGACSGKGMTRGVNGCVLHVVTRDSHAVAAGWRRSGWVRGVVGGSGKKSSCCAGGPCG